LVEDGLVGLGVRLVVLLLLRGSQVDVLQLVMAEHRVVAGEDDLAERAAEVPLVLTSSQVFEAVIMQLVQLKENESDGKV